MLVEGPAGAGKSALLAAAIEQAHAAGTRVLTARGGELEQEHPFGLIRQLYEPALVSATSPRREELLSGVAAPAAWILGAIDGEAGLQAAGFAAMHAIYWVTVRLAAEQPLLLAVDDAHWGDASSLRALSYLGRRVQDLPVTLVVALRPNEPGAQAELLDQIRVIGDTHLTPRGLRPDSVVRLVRDRLPAADEELCTAFHAATAGNPLLLHELLRAVGASQLEPSAEAVLSSRVPSLGDRVLRRAERVDPAAPRVVRALAILGGEAPLDTVAELATLGKDDAGRIVHGLRLIEVLATEDPAAFAHPLTRHSVYDTIPVTERQSAHRQAADLLAQAGQPPEAVAAHLTMLPPSGDRAVAGAMAAAAEQASRRAAPDETVAWLERALAEGASEPQPAHLLAKLGVTKALLRDTDAVVHLRAAFDQAEDGALRHQVGVALAEVLAFAGQWEQNQSVIDALERSPEGAGREQQAEVAALRAAISLYDPRGRADFDRRRAEYRKLSREGFWASKAIATLLANDASRAGRPDEGLSLAREAMEGGKLLGERGAGAWTPPQLLGVFVEADDLEGAATALELVDAAARSSGSIVAVFSVPACRGWAAARCGDLAAAEADLTTALQVANEGGVVMGLTTLAYYMIDVLAERDGLQEAAQLIERTELPPDFLATASGAMLLEARAVLRLLEGRRQPAIADLRAAGRINSTLRFGPIASSWRSRLVLALPRNAREEAMALAVEELELSRSAGLPRPVGVSLRALGVLTGGARGSELLRESVSVLQGSPARLEHARSVVELGAALRRANARAEARQLLLRGAELAHRCGAQRLTRRAQQELQAAGGRRRRFVSSGRDALTPSELRVAQLAAAGRTNAEIAEQLYVSPKTVETHLSRAYAKLDITGAGSRERLAELLIAEA